MPRKLTDWITSYIEYTDNDEPALIFRTWAAVSAIASALQRKCFIRWSGKLYPNMYIILIGPSGKARKGTAMKPALSIMQEIGITIAANDLTRQALVQTMMEISQTPPIIKPGGAPILHASLTIFSKELNVFLGFQNLELIANLCDWYDCDDVWEYRTVGRQQEKVEGVWVNLFAATTPEGFEKSLPKDMIGSGLTSRMVFVYDDKAGIVWDPFNVKYDPKLKDHLTADLRSIMTMQGQFIPTDAFLYTRYKDWYINTRKNPPFKDPKFAGYNMRRADHLLKLSVVMSASRSDTMKIDATDFDRAKTLLELTERRMPRAFAGVGDYVLAGAIERVAASVMLQGSLKFNDLFSIHYHDLSKEDLNNVILSLETLGRVKVTGNTIHYIGGEEDGQTESVSEVREKQDPSEVEGDASVQKT